MVIAGLQIEWQYRNNISGSINQLYLKKMAPRLQFCVHADGEKMTDQIGTGKRKSFSCMEILSVVAIALILVMIAVPFPYASRDHALPALHRASDRGAETADTVRSDMLKSLGEGKTASFGYASQGSPFEVRTVGRREFCADMPGLVRFGTAGPRCRNGTVVPSAQLSREQLRP